MKVLQVILVLMIMLLIPLIPFTTANSKFHNTSLLNNYSNYPLISGEESEKDEDSEKNDEAPMTRGGSHSPKDKPDAKENDKPKEDDNK